MIETQTLDTEVGRMVHGKLQARVSLRGEVIVLRVGNDETQRGFEVSFAPDKADEFASMIMNAVNLARGAGR